MTAMESGADDIDEAVSRPAELDPDANVPSISARTMEIVVAILLVLVAITVLWDSYGIGAGWTEGLGPESGYFPAKLGWVFLALAIFLTFQAFRRRSDEVFVTLPQLKQVAKILIPLTLYIALIKPLGIYVASALFIAGLMLIVGGSKWYSILLTAVGAPLLAFWVFELQFQVPLPKGPLEIHLGY